MVFRGALNFVFAAVQPPFTLKDSVFFVRSQISENLLDFVNYLDKFLFRRSLICRNSIGITLSRPYRQEIRVFVSLQRDRTLSNDYSAASPHPPQGGGFNL